MVWAIRKLLFSISLVLTLTYATAAETQYQNALKAYKKKQFQSVIQILSRQIENLNADELLLLGKSYGQLGDSQNAIKSLNAAAAIAPQNPQIKTELGRFLLLTNKEREALQMLRSALELNLTNEEAYLLISKIYEKQKNKYELRLLYQDMVEKIGEKPQYIQKLCAITTEEGLYDLSLKYCRRSIVLSPRDPIAHISLAITLKETGQTDQAKKSFDSISRRFKKSDVAQLSVARFYDEQKAYTQAYKHYKLAVDANPKNIDALAGLGLSAFEIRKYQESLHALQKACQIDKSAGQHLRRVNNTLRTTDESAWLKQFERALDTCGN